MFFCIIPVLIPLLRSVAKRIRVRLYARSGKRRGSASIQQERRITSHGPQGVFQRRNICCPYFGTIAPRLRLQGRSKSPLAVIVQVTPPEGAQSKCYLRRNPHPGGRVFARRRPHPRGGFSPPAPVRIRRKYPNSFALYGFQPQTQFFSRRVVFPAGRRTSAASAASAVSRAVFRNLPALPRNTAASAEAI